MKLVASFMAILLVPVSNTTNGPALSLTLSSASARASGLMLPRTVITSTTSWVATGYVLASPSVRQPALTPYTCRICQQTMIPASSRTVMPITSKTWPLSNSSIDSNILCPAFPWACMEPAPGSKVSRPPLHPTLLHLPRIAWLSLP